MSDWIVVVDDDPLSLKVAWHILGKNNMQVTGLSSGKELLKFLEDNRPDLILLDIMMPDMDGFATLAALRKQEQEKQLEEVPVIFLTSEGDKSIETKGFEVGVADFIRKPFDSGVLIKRITNILTRQDQINRFQLEATIDKLTDLLNKGAVEEKLDMICRRKAGYLLMVDLDAFKLVNDIYGHDTGDKVLELFSDLIKKYLGPEDIIGRIGGDEFIAYVFSFESENDLKRFSIDLNAALVEGAKEYMNGSTDIPIGASIGAVYGPGQGTSFSELEKKADKALYSVKEHGKHGYSMYGTGSEEDSDDINLKNLSMILSERNISNSALKLDKDSFINVYRFVMRYIMRYHRDACKLLFTLSPKTEEPGEEFDESCQKFGEHTSNLLRKSDLLMQYKKNQFFIFLTDIKEEAIAQVVGNVIRTWREKNGDDMVITYEIEFLKSEEVEKSDGKNLWVVVVDDDAVNLKVAGHVLSKNNMKVTTLSSGAELLEFVSDKRPDLILLDVNMPGLSGFETLEKLRAEETEIADIPVIFLTGDNDKDAEKKGLSLGAMDFIRKPFVPEVLTLRVKQIVELLRLQKHLAEEVGRKSKENEQLFLNVVSSLAGAIDAKDTYTKGHSGRVAEYAREISRRYGYNMKEQSDIFIMGLLHDVGKIGVPDAVINKPGKLTDEEFEYIKKHPVVGSQILKKIKEMPKLSVGARWHHERYDGKGYPDGLKGDEIPEEARIIAVADAYDAMTSNRSYRHVMSQDKVREEILKGKGTQFDPRFADIMLTMMDEDKGFNMREEFSWEEVL